MSKIEGQNMSTIKINNRNSILKTIHRFGAMSRKEIASLVNLTPAAVTIITNEMIDEGILVEKGEIEEEKKRSGRKKILLDINYHYKYAIGITIEYDGIDIGITNLKGDIINYKKLHTIDSNNAMELLKVIGDQCIRLMWEADITKEKILGIGVGVVGYVDQKKGISKAAFGLWNEEVKIKEVLENELNVPVFVDNNVRALSIAEILFGIGKNLSNFLFVKYGPGVGATIITQGKIYKGVHNKAGELGHYIVNPDSKKRCRCGLIGCLELEVSEGEIINKVKLIFSERQTPYLFNILKGEKEQINIDNIYLAAKKGDEKIISIIDSMAKNFSIALANTIRLLDVDKVVLYGKSFEKEIFFNLLEKYIKIYNRPNNIDDLIVKSELRNKGTFIGGSALVINTLFYNSVL